MTSNEEFIKKNKVVLVDDDKNTKLHYAAVLGNLDEIKKTIKNGQKLDPVNYMGWTPLMMAVRTGNSKTVDLLLDHGADATKKNKFGANVFLISVTCGQLNIVEKILNHLLCGGVSRQSLQKVLSPLSVAILFQQDTIFRYLLARSFNPNAITPFTGLTPLMFAAALGNHTAIHQLLKFNADLKTQNYLGKRAPDILETRSKSIDIVNVKQKQQLPLILISPYNLESPNLQLTPQLTEPPIVDAATLARKSSNVTTPVIITPAGISPITPQITPYMFFGPDFTPSHFITSTTPLAYHSNNFLDTNISPNSAFVSPILPQQICHNNYV